MVVLFDLMHALYSFWLVFQRWNSLDMSVDFKYFSLHNISTL